MLKIWMEINDEREFICSSKRPVFWGWSDLSCDFCDSSQKAAVQWFYLGREVVKVLCNESMDSETLAFVVMPDHVHWLVQTNQRPVSQTVQSAKSLSSRAITQLSGVADRIWQRGFHDHALRKDEDIQSVARYVVMNPVRAGIVKSVREYPLWDAIWL